MISVITPNYNGSRYLDRCLSSIIQQRVEGVDLECIVVDGGSTDDSLSVIQGYRDELDHVISEPDNGPASAINKGLRLARGDMVAWLNADDFYYPGALQRVVTGMCEHPEKALCFGRCRIVDEADQEIRKGITCFKEAFFPLSSRFTLQSINYISQPAMFFRRSAMEKVGLLREDMKAAWDYEFILRLWRQGGASRIYGGPLAAFRWHETSISGAHFKQQFKEEYEVALADAGWLSPQALLHWGVRWGIVGSYACMAWNRNRKRA